MGTALLNGRVLVDGAFLENAAVLVEGAKIAAVCSEPELPAGVERYDLDGGLLVPGFIDTQVNGGGGGLVNDSPTVEAIEAIGRADRR